MTADHNEAMRLADALDQPGVRYAAETEAQAKLRRIKTQAEAAALLRKQAEQIKGLWDQHHRDSAELRALCAACDAAKEIARKQAAELDTLRAWKARIIKAAEESHGPDAIRLKFSLNRVGEATNVFPKWLDQRWVSFVFAEDDAHIGLHAQIDTLRAEVERLRVDGERIDYLEYEANELRTRETGEDDYEWVVRSNHMDQPHERDVANGKTIRAAIDAARKATP